MIIDRKLVLLGTTAIACGISVGLVLLQRQQLPARTDDSIFKVESDDAALEQSVVKARATLPLFLTLKDRNKPGTREFSVKIPIGPKGNGQEFVWITPFTVQGDILKGTIADETHTPGFAFGQTIVFKLSDVTDWLYREGAKMKGNFSTCAFFSRKPKEEREKLFADYGLECST